MRSLCTVCANPAEFELFHPDADLYRCPKCDHCFSHPDTLRNDETYDASYFQETHRAWFSHPHSEMYEMLREGIERHHEGPKKLLDVGCGNARFLKFLREKTDWELTGIDLSPNEPVQGIELVQGDLAGFEPRERYDVVTSVMVVEHLEQLEQHRDKMVKLCKPGGLLVVLTINERSVLYLVARLLRFFGYRKPFDRLYSIHHLNHFNASSLAVWLEQKVSLLEQRFHNVPMSALDIPGSNPLLRLIQKVGVWFTFQLGQLTDRTYAQTVFARVGEAP